VEGTGAAGKSVRKKERLGNPMRLEDWIVFLREFTSKDARYPRHRQGAGGEDAERKRGVR